MFNLTENKLDRYVCTEKIRSCEGEEASKGLVLGQLSECEKGQLAIIVENNAKSNTVKLKNIAHKLLFGIDTVFEISKADFNSKFVKMGV